MSIHIPIRNLVYIPYLTKNIENHELVFKISYYISVGISFRCSTKDVSTSYHRSEKTDVVCLMVSFDICQQNVIITFVCFYRLKKN